MADVFAEFSAQVIVEVEKYAAITRTSTKEVLLRVREGIFQEKIQPNQTSSVGTPGRTGKLFKEEILLNPLWDYLATQAQSSNDCGRIQKENETLQARMLRDLRKQIEVICSSLRRQCHEQFPGESTDPLFVLSQFLSFCCEACWNLSCRKNEINFPLAGKIIGRVTALKGMGNAINPYVAAEVIRAYMAKEG